MNRQIKHTESKTFLADWIAGKITDKELQELVTPEDFLTYKKMQHAFSLLEKPKFKTTSFEDFKAKLPKKQAQSKKLIPHWAYAVAASILLILGIFQFLQTKIDYKTNTTESLQIALNEGTSIHLNAKSSVQYSKYQSQREVSLKGEAFFKVTKKGDFIVKTPNGTIAVLGTEFNVISREDFFEVICYEGKVAVTSENKTWTLLPGDAWRSIDHKTETWSTEQTSASWLQGETSFKSTPLQYVLKAIENQYNVKLITKELDSSMLFTGSFTHSNIDNALKSVCLPLGLTIKSNGKKVIVLSKK